MVDGPACVPPEPAHCTRLRNRTCSDQVAATDEVRARPDLDPAEDGALVDGQRDVPARRDALGQRPADPGCCEQRPRRDERKRLFAVRKARMCIGAACVHHRDDAVLRLRPDQERTQIGVAHRPRRLAEDRRVDGRATRPAEGSDLAPAGRVRVARLDADHAGQLREQVVPGVQHPAAGDRRRLLGDGSPNERVPHQQLREPGHVGRARALTRRVEAVRAHVVRVAQPQLRGLVVHQHRERGKARRDRQGERVGGVVGGLDQRRLHEIRDGEPLVGLEVGARLALPRPRADRRSRRR